MDVINVFITSDSFQFRYMCVYVTEIAGVYSNCKGEGGGGGRSHIPYVFVARLVNKIHNVNIVY